MLVVVITDIISIGEGGSIGVLVILLNFKKQAQNLSILPTRYVIINKSLKFSGPQFPNVQKTDMSTYAYKLLQVLM